MTLTLHTKSYYSYDEMIAEVEKNSGKKTRDWAGRYSSSPYNDSIPYQDFWHKMVDYVDIHNGTIISWHPMEMKEYFAEKEPAETWIGEICDLCNEVLGNPEEWVSLNVSW